LNCLVIFSESYFQTTQSGLENATRYVLLCVTRFAVVRSKYKERK